MIANRCEKCKNIGCSNDNFICNNWSEEKRKEYSEQYKNPAKSKSTLEFKSMDKFHITGRGEVIVVKSQSDKNIVGEVVVIDGEEYRVRGVEIQGCLREGKNIGLLVSKISEEKQIKTENGARKIQKDT